jgi:PadR family transcriptional regulator, regulatory protein AphA
MPARPTTTTTSYCLLGLLNLRPFSAYELTKYMRRSALADLWPRTEAAIYRESGRLVDAGLATVSTEQVGNRTRSIYAITPEGRRALRSWLREPGASLTFECEAAVKAFFGDATDVASIRVQLQSIVETNRTRASEMVPVMQSWVQGSLPFPERLHYTAMAADLISRIEQATHSWAEAWLENLDDWKGTQLDPMKEDQANTVLADLEQAASRF